MIAIGLAVLGAVGALIGIWAFVDARRNRRVKLLAWEPTFTRALASASKADRDYKLSILYERPGQQPEVIEGAYATYVRFANFGREPIRRADIAAANPLRINVKMGDDSAGEVLDISLTSASREVIRLAVGSVVRADNSAHADIEFDFLDHHDGGVVRVLSSGRPKSTVMSGDIIGIPAGLTRSDVPLAKGPWGKIGFGLWAVAELCALALIALLFKRQTGGWGDVWVLALPPLAFVAIVIATAIISDSVWPTARSKRKFPSALALPKGAHFRVPDRMLVYPDDLAWDFERSVTLRPTTSADKSDAPEDTARGRAAD
jgi:hypothetical protein